MKRRVQRQSSKDGLLPLTAAEGASDHIKRRRPPSTNKSDIRNLYGIVVCLFLVLGLGFFVIVEQRKHSRLERDGDSLLDPYKDYLQEALAKRGIKPDRDGKYHHHDEHSEHEATKTQTYDRLAHEPSPEDLPLHQFASLRYPLINSKIVLLYFAASWCPMSTPVTHEINALFSHALMKPLPQIVFDHVPRHHKRHGASLVYVSSDNSPDELAQYRKSTWMAVPFDHADKNDLKRHFRTCAKKELDELGMEDRDREIPSLIVLSGTTQKVLSYDGVDDVGEHGADALQYWWSLDDEQIAQSTNSRT